MQCHAILCHVMSCHVMSCHVMSCHVMSCHVMSCHVMSCHVMSFLVKSCHVMSCHIISYHVMSCHVMPCHAMPCHVMSCHVMSCHVMSCHAMAWHAMPCHAMPCHATPNVYMEKETSQSDTFGVAWHDNVSDWVDSSSIFSAPMAHSHRLVTWWYQVRIPEGRIFVIVVVHIKFSKLCKSMECIVLSIPANTKYLHNICTGPEAKGSICLLYK